MRKLAGLLTVVMLLAAVIPLSAQVEQPPAQTQTGVIIVAPEIYDRAGEALDSGDYARAVMDYSTFILLNPTFGPAYTNRAFGYQSMGDMDSAIADFTQALSFATDDGQYQAYLYSSRAQAEIANNDLPAALSDLDAAIEADPAMLDNYLLRGAIYVEQQQLEDALADFDHAVELDPSSAAAFLQRGIVNLALGTVDQALSDFNEAIRINPQYSEAYGQRGSLNAQLGNLDAAVADYSQMIALNPQSVDGYFGRAVVYATQQEFQSALDDLSSAIDLQPELSSLYLYRGSINAQVENQENAASDYLQWISLNQTRAIDQDTLRPGNSVSLEMNQGWVYRIPFQALAGQLVNAQANSAAADPLLVLLGTDGSPLTGDDDGGGNLNAAISNYAVPSDGTYTLVVGHAGGGSEGSISVQLGVR